MPATHRLIPIFSTRGDVSAFLGYPYIFNRLGEWIGWATLEREVYSVHGHYVGFMTSEPRILRKASDAFDRPLRSPPAAPPKINPPANLPLPPLMAELAFGMLDVLQDAPDLLPPVDFGDLRQDMD
jgi:hypothetical protein